MSNFYGYIGDKFYNPNITIYGIMEVMSLREEYVAIKLPKDLIQEMDRLVGTHGYRSRAEIAKDAIRRLITNLREAQG